MALGAPQVTVWASSRSRECSSCAVVSPSLSSPLLPCSVLLPLRLPAMARWADRRPHRKRTNRSNRGETKAWARLSPSFRRVPTPGRFVRDRSPSRWALGCSRSRQPVVSQLVLAWPPAAGGPQTDQSRPSGRTVKTTDGSRCVPQRLPSFSSRHDDVGTRPKPRVWDGTWRRLEPPVRRADGSTAVGCNRQSVADLAHASDAQGS